MYFSPSTKDFYDSPVIPDCFEVSPAIHNYILEQVGKGKIIELDVDNMPIAVSPPPTNTEPTTVEGVYQWRLGLLNTAYEAAASFLKSTYPATETDTWYRQLNEAALYQTWVTGGAVGNPPPTQFLDILLSERQSGGVTGDMMDLVTRILGLNSVYTPLLASLTGHRHVAEKALNNARSVGDIPALKLVSWDFMSIFSRS